MALGAAAVLCAYFPIAAEQTSVTTAPAAVVPELLKNYVPLTTEMFVKPKADNWITYRNNYGLWGYSALKQVHAGNVASLKMVWSRAMEDGPQEVEPYVYNGVMFLYHARDIVQALDATTGDLLWEYKRKLPANIGSTTGSINRYRNLALYADKVFIATQDAYLVALDAKTGQMVWETKRGDYMDKVAATAGPVVVEGKLITGTRCDPSSPLSGGCYVTAHDARNGEEVWRVHTIAKPGEAGGDTWGDLPVEERKHASAWMVGSYDPELKLVYWGTGVTGLGRDVLFGKGNPDLLYTNSTLAVDAITGKRVWYYQHLPRDYRDLDHAFERMIVETSVAPDPREVPWINPRLKPGERRKVITGIPGKTGIVWTLDAKTGEFLWARPTTPQTVMTGVDLATGKPIVNEPNPPADGDDNPVISCPHLFGGKNQPSGAYSPDTNAMYMPLHNACSIIPAQRMRNAPTGFISGSMTYVPGADPATAKIGRLEAISASTGKTIWKYEQRAPMYSSVLTTGGNLVFNGDFVRRFRAFNAENGRILWETILSGPVTARPVTYSVGGRQYVAVGAGGNSLGSAFLGLTPELKSTGGSNVLYVFALPGS